MAPLLGGCAYVTAIPVPPDSTIEGIRFYEVKPILIVNDQAVDIQMVPNYNRAYALRFGSFLSKHTMDVTFERGFIKAMKSEQDATAFIQLLTTLADKIPLTSFSGTATTGGATGRFGVYEFVFDEEGNLVRLRPLLRREDLMILPAVGQQKVASQTPQVPGGKEGGGPATGAGAASGGGSAGTVKPPGGGR
ncbi:hypothetical protein [Ancylobacter aquaticus]|uniref:hypothetical protein n=1 Tax=Ancylobacter aquaticus TaxID=100 RepID=UPI0010474E94|nr:hypothetical protein [Ancylobacter aquaticus]